MFSRLSGNIKELLINYNIKVTEDYKTLKEAFLKIFGGEKKTSTENQIELAFAQQEDKNFLFRTRT